MLDKAQARNRVILALISGFVVRVACKSFFGRFVLNELSKNGRFVSNSAKIWICGLYLLTLVTSFSIRSCILKVFVKILTTDKGFSTYSHCLDDSGIETSINSANTHIK